MSQEQLNENKKIYFKINNKYYTNDKEKAILNFINNYKNNNYHLEKYKNYKNKIEELEKQYKLEKEIYDQYQNEPFLKQEILKNYYQKFKDFKFKFREIKDNLDYGEDCPLCGEETENEGEGNFCVNEECEKIFNNILDEFNNILKNTVERENGYFEPWLFKKYESTSNNIIEAKKDFKIHSLIFERDIKDFYLITNNEINKERNWSNEDQVEFINYKLVINDENDGEIELADFKGFIFELDKNKEQ